MGIRLLQHLQGKAEIHLIITHAAEEIIKSETDYEISDIKCLANVVYNNDCLSAPIASGSFLMDAMVVLPCSIKSLSAIAMSYNENLLVRAADVTLKESRTLVLGVREMPLHEGHLNLMLTLARRGAVLCPPVPAFYYNPESITDICDYFSGKIMDLLRIENQLFKRWNGVNETKVNCEIGNH